MTDEELVEPAAGGYEHDRHARSIDMQDPDDERLFHAALQEVMDELRLDAFPRFEASMNFHPRVLGTANLYLQHAFASTALRRDEELSILTEHAHPQANDTSTPFFLYLLVFSSDNGGEATVGDKSSLCGYKRSIFEGGLRMPAVVTGISERGAAGRGRRVHARGGQVPATAGSGGRGHVVRQVLAATINAEATITYQSSSISSRWIWWWWT